LELQYVGSIIMTTRSHTGILEVVQGASARIRLLDNTLIATPSDPVMPVDLISRYGLRPGVELEVELGQPARPDSQRPGKKSRKSKGKKKKKKKKKEEPIGPGARVVSKVLKVEDDEPEKYASGRKFEDLTTVDPHPRLALEYPDCPPACRLIDLFCPIGFGTRGMIVSPPKAGKTILLQHIAAAISKSHPDVEVVALLIDERPEEVTDFRRNVPCTVLASSNDHEPLHHVRLATLTIERAKRHAEAGRDIVVLLDSLTRVGRAFNTAPGMSNSGRTLSGGLDSSALSIPKQLFGAARRFDEGGSLTTIATVLTDTGSRGDQIIFEEFKGTGNMELILDRSLSERRLFPSIDLAASGTRKEHLLLNDAELNTMTALRRRLLSMQPNLQIEQLLKALERFKTNADMTGK